jgi:diguanylate cyclase (GGDEF)-like protein
MDRVLENLKQVAGNEAPPVAKTGEKKAVRNKSFYLRLPENLPKKDRQQQSLTRAYKGALGIIAALTIIGHTLTAYITNNQRESAEITFRITNLHSLVDVIVSQAAIYKASRNSFDDDLLSQSIEQLKKERLKIDAQNGDNLNAIFHAPPFLLSDKIKTFILMAEEFSSDQRTEKYADAATALATLTNTTAKILAINLDLALEQYRNDTLQQIEQSYSLQYYTVLIVLCVLLLEAAFIFRPLVLRLGEYHQDLIKLALTDMLTGLNNRRAFMQLAYAGLDHFKRHKKPFALILMDLDKFKSINDLYGHKVGDLVLQHYSMLMHKSLRAHDTMGRIGGEEFAIFLPETGAEGAMKIIERFRKRVMDTPCPYVDKDGEKKSLNYTSSFGIASVTEGVWTLDELFIKADECLYKAKHQGRNCVVMEKL